jgi:hypothetical protein
LSCDDDAIAADTAYFADSFHWPLITLITADYIFADYHFG